MRRHLTVRPRLLAVAAVAWCALVASPSLQADEHGRGDHDLALQALEQGKVLPLRTVLDRVEREYRGQVLKVEFERDDARFLYRIRLLQGDGRVVKLKVDAGDGKVLEFERKGH